MSNLKFNEIRALGLAEYFYRLAEQSGDVFWIKSADYKKQIYISPAFESIWGVSCKSLYEDPSLWVSSMLPEDRERLHHDCLNRTAEPLKTDIFEKKYRIVRPDQSIRFIHDVSFALFDADGKCFGYAGTCRDVSKDMLHKQELEEAKQTAEIANQGKADFLAMMSHELRTPLNAVLGITQILQMKTLSKELQEYISIISMAGNSLLSLVNDVLDFAKLEVGQLSFSNDPIDLYLLISQVVQSLKHQAKEKGTDLLLDYNDHVPRFIVGDAKRIRQIIVNLIGNAIKFTEQGRIDVLITCKNQTHEKALFYIEIKDTGIGIPANKLDFIFGKFNQIESVNFHEHSGVGLGLSITKQLLEKMGSEIKVKSECGKGSVFYFTLSLPLQKKLFSLNEVQKFNPKIDYTKLKLDLLLVEDNFINQTIAKNMLQEIGCTLDIVDTGEAAIAQLNLKHYDAILMDIGLPDINGFELALQVRQETAHKQKPILALTAHILEADKQKCFSAGMNGIITKPLCYEELIENLYILCKAS